MRSKIRSLTLAAALLTAAFSGCTKSSKEAAPAGQPEKKIVAAKPDEHGVLKCPDGKEPTHLAGKCKGTWHAAKSKTGKPTNYCEFDWSSPISCASEGYADDAHADCYGPPYVIDTGANLLTEHDCAQKYPTPPNGAQYNLNCCAK